MTSFVERRMRPRTSRQKISYWTRKVLRLAIICYVAGLLVASGVTAGHKAVTAKAQAKK